MQPEKDGAEFYINVLLLISGGEFVLTRLLRYSLVLFIYSSINSVKGLSQVLSDQINRILPYKYGERRYCV
jgi:hypothetical protein